MRQHTIQTPYPVGEVHCYSTEIKGELILFDSGPPTAEAFATLCSQIELSRLKYLFLTHFHIDHHGLVAMIAENSDATILIPRADAWKLRHYQDSLEHLVGVLTDIGCDESSACYIKEKSERENLATKFPGNFQIVEDSDVPLQLGIDWLNCPGHSQSDLVYLCGEHAITGDILLRNIFQVPILEVNLETFCGRFRNYDAYCESIKKLGRLREYRIHPGHRWQVENVDTTILFYVKKLLEQADQIKKLARHDSILDIMKLLYGRIYRKPFLVHMKISEIVFTKDFIDDPYRLKASLQSLCIFDEIGDLFHTVVG